MAQPKKPDTRLGQPANYGKLLAGHDTALGIAAVKAAAAACPHDKSHPPERHKSWSKGLTIKH